MEKGFTLNRYLLLTGSIMSILKYFSKKTDEYFETCLDVYPIKTKKDCFRSRNRKSLIGSVLKVLAQNGRQFIHKSIITAFDRLIG